MFKGLRLKRFKKSCVNLVLKYWPTNNCMNLFLHNVNSSHNCSGQPVLVQVLNQKGAALGGAGCSGTCKCLPCTPWGISAAHWWKKKKKRFCLSKVLTDYSNVHGLHVWIHFAASVEWCLQQTRQFSCGHCDTGRTSAVSLIILMPIHLCACRGVACIKHWNAVGFFQLLHFSVSLETSSALQRSSY